MLVHGAEILTMLVPDSIRNSEMTRLCIRYRRMKITLLGRLRSILLYERPRHMDVAKAYIVRLKEK